MMILNYKRFIINNFGLPVDSNSLSLFENGLPKCKPEVSSEVICIKSDHEDSFFDKINTNLKNQYEPNSKKLNPADMNCSKGKTRIYVVEGDQETIFSKLKDMSINSLIMNKEKELLKQTKDKDLEIYSMSPSTHGENEVNLNQKLKEDNNIIYIKSSENDGCKLLREVEELSESVTSCVKLKGHPCSISHKYNKTTRRMNKVITCNYEGCGKQFTKSWNILDHFKVHTGDRPFVCETCGRAFSQKGNLSKHKKLHTERKYFEFDF